MPTVEEIDARLAALYKIRASGVAMISHENKRIQYRTDEEISREISDLERQKAVVTGTRITRSYAKFSKG